MDEALAEGAEAAVEAAVEAEAAVEVEVAGTPPIIRLEVPQAHFLTLSPPPCSAHLRARAWVKSVLQECEWCSKSLVGARGAWMHRPRCPMQPQPHSP